MKTAEEYWDESKHDSWVMYKKDFMFCLGEKDAEIVKIIDEMVKHFESKYKRANKAKGYLATQIDEDMKTGIQVGKCEAYSKIIEALTELKEKLCVGSAG